MAAQRLKFDANLSFLFPEIDNLVLKYKIAKDSGFTAVECGCDIYNYPIEELVKAKQESNQQQILINSFTGKSYGLACVPQRFEEFKQCLELSIQYCKSLDCQLLHVMAGQYPENAEVTPELKKLYSDTFVENMKYVSSRLEVENIKGLIEPISTIPKYFLNRTDQALELLNQINCPNIKLQLDMYHQQRTHGNIVETISRNLDKIGHIQISQVPGRHEPNENGEINYKFIFNHLLKIGYNGWLGCEYIPSDSFNSLSWLHPYLTS